MTKEQREPELKRLWLQRPREKRTMNDLLAFTVSLQQECPELLPSSRYGDPYQQLKVVLSDYIVGE